jgi:NAD(P)-dependent dehydrogenase (short-subunit alcohol dehydrogenase family)
MTNWLITGVSSGLGKALAAAVLARGDALVGAVRRPVDAAALEALAPGRSHAVIVDLSDAGAAAEAVSQAEAALGQIDVLVNNAGYGLLGAVEESNLTEIRAVFEVNVFAPIAMMQAVLPAMRARRSGRIINVTSVSGRSVWAGTGIYSSTKFALEGAALTLAEEVEPLGIKVTNVEPGGMRTDYAGRSLHQTQRQIDDYASIPAKTILHDHAGHEPGDPDKIAAVILKLAEADAPPRQLLLGADAMHYASAQDSRRHAEMGQWAKVSLSVMFD